MLTDCDISLGYNFLVVGAIDAGVRGAVSSYMEEPTHSNLSTSRLRANQKLLKLADNRILILDIIQRPGDIFRECCGDLARSHGVLLVYNPSSLTSFQYVVGFFEQLIRSKWRCIPVVLFSNAPTPLLRGVNPASRSNARDFANMHCIQFVEASRDRSSPAPFPTLLSLVRQHFEAQVPPSPGFGEGVMDLLTVAAARVSHVTRSHLPTLPLTPTRRRTSECPPRVRRYDLAGSLSPPGPASKFRP